MPDSAGAAKGASPPTRVGTEAAGAWVSYRLPITFWVDLVKTAWNCGIF